MEAADEIGLAVIATTFTLIAVFLPTAFMSGVAGRFFVQFGWTASLAVFASLVVARMLTPMMAAYLLKPDVPHDDGRIMRGYLHAARWSLQHRAVATIAAAVFFAGLLLLVPLLPTGFMPSDDLSQTQVHIELPPGSTFERTLAAAEQARALVQRNEHVVRVYTAVGGGSAGADPFIPQGVAEVRKATLTLDLTPREQRRGTSKQQIEGALRPTSASRRRRLPTRCVSPLPAITTRGWPS